MLFFLQRLEHGFSGTRQRDVVGTHLAGGDSCS